MDTSLVVSSVGLLESIVAFCSVADNKKCRAFLAILIAMEDTSFLMFMATGLRVLLSTIRFLQIQQTGLTPLSPLTPLALRQRARAQRFLRSRFRVQCVRLLARRL